MEVSMGLKDKTPNIETSLSSFANNKPKDVHKWGDYIG